MDYERALKVGTRLFCSDRQLDCTPLVWPNQGSNPWPLDHEQNVSCPWYPSHQILFLVQVQLRTEVLHTPSSTRLGFELMISRSWWYFFLKWWYISCHWDACSNHSAISDLTGWKSIPTAFKQYFLTNVLSTRLAYWAFGIFTHIHITWCGFARPISVNGLLKLSLVFMCCVGNFNYFSFCLTCALNFWMN